MAIKKIQFKIQFLNVKSMVAIEIYFRNTKVYEKLFNWSSTSKKHVNI